MKILFNGQLLFTKKNVLRIQKKKTLKEIVKSKPRKPEMQDI